LKFAIDFAIPDVPYEVQMARIKNLYEADQVLRREVRQNICKYIIQSCFL
jgi:hypothetical protein